MTMDKFELNKLIEKTEERIKVACADACEGANVSTEKWAKLGNDVSTALEMLRQELRFTPPIPSDSVSNAITFNRKQYVLGIDGTCVYVTCDGERVWQDPPKKKTK